MNRILTILIASDYNKLMNKLLLINKLIWNNKMKTFKNKK